MQSWEAIVIMKQAQENPKHSYVWLKALLISFAFETIIMILILEMNKIQTQYLMNPKFYLVITFLVLFGSIIGFFINAFSIIQNTLLGYSIGHITVFTSFAILIIWEIKHEKIGKQIENMRFQYTCQFVPVRSYKTVGWPSHESIPFIQTINVINSVVAVKKLERIMS